MSGKADKTWAQKFWQQYVALLKKNALVAWRNRMSTATRLLSPVIFLVILLLLNFILKSDDRDSERFKDVKHPPNKVVEQIPQCMDDLFLKDGCLDFVYSPVGNAATEEIVRNIRESNVPAIPESRVKGFADLGAANQWLYNNPEKALGGLHLNVLSDSDITFTLQANHSVKFFRGKFQDPSYFFEVPMQVATQREMVRYQAKAAKATGWEDMFFQISWKYYAHPYLASYSIIGTSLGTLLFAANMFSFVITMTGIITERENKLTQALSTMGMLSSAYWASWVTWEVAISFVITMLSCMFGAIFQFDFFLNNNFGNVFFVLFLFQLGMCGLAFLLATFIRKSTVAIILGFVVFLVGWITQLVVVFGYPYSTTYYKDYGGIVTIIFTFLPWAPFAKAVNELGQATVTSSSPGLEWERRNSYCIKTANPLGEGSEDSGGEYFKYKCIMPIGEVMLWNMAHFLGYLLLAIYLTEVLPDSNGVRKNPLYFLMPSFWNPKAYKTQSIRTKQEPYPALNSKDEDVAAEETKMKNRLEGSDSSVNGNNASTHRLPAVEVYGLQRHFNRRSFWAIKDSWFEIKQQQLFCLLGPNGAGKSTTINVLTGVLPPTGGDALVNGESLMSPGGMESIRSSMGVCPQFDLLWGELTASEHMYLFGHIKGLKDTATVRAESNKLLDEVNLTYAATMRTSSYSGGMKRRLSVAVALIGDPKIVYLDEPTTGMDPISRRQVWDIIEKAKKGRAIVLTTHSMEEADILGDRIAIMARGALRCIGSSIRLKQRFGAGYKVSISVMSAGNSHEDPSAAAARASQVKQLLQERFGLAPDDETKAYITYLIGRDFVGRLQELLSTLEQQRAALGITDVQIALTSLEEVFLNIAKQAEVEAAQQNNTLVDLTLADGHVIKMLSGADTATDSRDGTVYNVTWGQTDTGALVITKHERA